MRKAILFSFTVVFLNFLLPASAQEIMAKVTVNGARVGTGVSKNLFSSLQGAMNNFINSRVWTRDRFEANERIECNFFLNIEQSLGNNLFKGRLIVQSARPVFNSGYSSPVVNYQDNEVVFRYLEGQGLEFNESRVQGNDPATANLSAILAFYSYVIIGLDYSSFSMRAGDAYFRKALDIVSNAPESSDIKGWKSLDGLRNRYWIAENLNNSTYAQFHEAIYTYYRKGMDMFSEDDNTARSGVLNALTLMSSLNYRNPNSMALQFFFQGKGNEIFNVFNKASNDMRLTAKRMLTEMDLVNANLYKDL